MLNYTRQVNWLLGIIDLSLLRSVIYFDDNENGEASSSSLDQSLLSVSWKRQQFVRVSSHSMKRTQPCEILVRPWMVLAQSLRGRLSWNKNKMGALIHVQNIIKKVLWVSNMISTDWGLGEIWWTLGAHKHQGSLVWETFTIEPLDCRKDYFNSTTRKVRLWLSLQG